MNVKGTNRIHKKDQNILFVIIHLFSVFHFVRQSFIVYSFHFILFAPLKKIMMLVNIAQKGNYFVIDACSGMLSDISSSLTARE